MYKMCQKLHLFIAITLSPLSTKFHNFWHMYAIGNSHVGLYAIGNMELDDI